MKYTVARISANADADAEIKFTAEFSREHAVFRADVLQDALAQITRAYNAAIEDMSKKL